MGGTARRGFEDHFSEQAAGYAAHRPRYPRELADYLADLAPGRDLAWDGGCGSGQLASLLSTRFDRVVATDASREQLGRAHGSPGLHYRLERAEASSLPAGSSDLSTAAQAAHWFDLEGYYGEVRRVGRPHSGVALISYQMMRIDEGVDRVIDRFYADVLDPYWPAGRRHVEDGYRSMPFPFDEVETPRFDMRDTRTLAGVLGYVETWSAVRRLVRNEGRTAVDRFRVELSDAWGAPGDARPVRWPLALRVGRLRP